MLKFTKVKLKVGFCIYTYLQVLTYFKFFEDFARSIYTFMCLICYSCLELTRCGLPFPHCPDAQYPSHMIMNVTCTHHVLLIGGFLDECVEDTLLSCYIVVSLNLVCFPKNDIVSKKSFFAQGRK